EPITNFLVRETLGFEEFNEALVRLREERQGLTIDKQLFGLETLLRKEEVVTERERWSDESWSGWRRGWWDEEDWAEEPAPEDQSAGADQDAEVAAEDVPVDGGGRSPTRAPPEDQGGEGQTPPEGAQTEDETFDSFILDVLRGWRLLQAASLTLEERRDVLTATSNRLDFESVSNALQVLWDEQLSGVRRHGHGSHLYQGAQVLDEQAQYDPQWEEQGWEEESWPEGHWEDAQYHGESPEAWAEEWEQVPSNANPDVLTNAELDDPTVRDALQAERAAEAMAADAALTWKRAQQATAAVRKDRGFGASEAFRLAQKGDQCHKCGSYGHFARDCKGSGAKGRPKGALSMEYDYGTYDHMYYIGGKGKKKGKTKGHFGLGKGPMHKGKIGKQPRMFPGVNAYGLEMLGTEGDLSLGCYASQEKDAYGSGAWGRAQYHVTLSSKVSGYEKQFGMSHIGPEGAGMIIDFNDGHYILDVAAYLTGGQTCKTGTQWPCFGEHPELTVGNNKYAQWKHCATCCYRVSYVPREGAPGSDSKTENFPTIRKALAQLHEDIGDVQPEGEMVKVAIDLEYARNRYHQLIQKFDRRRAPATRGPTTTKATLGPSAAKPSTTPTLKSGYKETELREDGAMINPNLVDMEDGPPGPTFPKRVAAGVMAMVAVLTNVYRGELQALTTQRHQCSIWEIGCGPTSMLTTACQHVGLGALRVNHVNGYDLYKAETYPALKALFDQHRPRRIWVSPRSDRWQPWGHLSHENWQAGQDLESRRRHEHTMLRRMCSFLAWAMCRNSLLEIFWEWPAESLGWKEPALRDLEKAIWSRNKDWLACRVDGCRYGVREGEKGDFIKKRRLIRTTCPRFHTLFKTKVCVQNHAHVEVPVMESKGRLDYPWRFAKSVAQSWRDHLFPLRHFGMPAEAYNFAAEEIGDDEVPEIEPDPPNVDGIPPDRSEPTDEERGNWDRKLKRFHSAAGHPSNHQLARIVKEAGKPKWMVEAAMKFSCPHCEAVRPGGLSSKQIPPLSTRPLPCACQQVVADVGEWTSVAQKCKLKFVVFVDAATKLRVAEPLFRLGISEMRSETGTHLVEAFSKRWLSDKPKPEILIPDNARSFTSKHFQDFCSSVNVWLDVKEVMEKIQLGVLIISVGLWQAVLLFTMRNEAEQRAREVRAQRVLSKLKNSITRQPLRTFQATDMVKVWRRALPLEVHRGRQGGSKKAGRYHWIGPGRVVLQETVPHQASDDPRRHIIWVVIGGKLYRCAAHSVRPVTEQERAWHHLRTEENPTKWRSLQDVIPSKEYTDLSEQLPPGDDPDDHHPDLPGEPDESTWMPSKRLRRKQSEQQAAAPPLPPPVEEPVNDYGEYSPSEPGDELGVPGTLSGWAREFDRDLEAMDRQAASKREATSSTAPPSDSKKARTESFEEELTLHSALQECEYGYVMEIDLQLTSNRQMKKFLRSPSAYLVGKMRDSEVRWEQLSAAHKKLFSRAKTKEVTSFIQQAAVRKCADLSEEKEAQDSGRIMKCRWVLTWKPIPEEERAEAEQELATKADTTIDETATRKAKARIVLLGYQHPDLLREGFNSSAPVQSVLTRNLAYQMTVQNNWTLEGLDLSTAFLQTAPKEEMRIWTQGVAELREALGVGDDKLLRVLKDFYGSTTAPRGLNDMDRFKTIGMMGGHVDDFNRARDLENPRWLELREKIDKAYKRGTIKRGSYRHAGTDIVSSYHPDDGNVIEINQDQYIEAIADFPLAAAPGRVLESALSDRKVSQCRAALGSLQWVAVQTQPLICARCNLILSDLASRPTFALAKELQQLIEEVRNEPMRLRFKPIKDASHWQDIHIVTLGDQAHNNRPKGGSTGGLLTFIGGPSHASGVPGPLVLLGWKTWKLQRVAIGSTDAEVQAMVEAEDLNLKTRLIWAELNGATVEKGHDFLKAAEEAASHVPGILGTDSKGGYDAVVRHEGPDLGLSNARAAIQGHQLKEGMRRVRTKLIWLASDFNLSDALTKRASECRRSFVQFLRTGVWMLRFNPDYVVSAKKAKKQGLDAVTQLRQATRKAHQGSKKLLGLVQHSCVLGCTM
ncbi:unnamed protein product, partial [Symbiodinium sp. CCMP2592]